GALRSRRGQDPRCSLESVRTLGPSGGGRAVVLDPPGALVDVCPLVLYRRGIVLVSRWQDRGSREERGWGECSSSGWPAPLGGALALTVLVSAAFQRFRPADPDDRPASALQLLVDVSPTSPFLWGRIGRVVTTVVDHRNVGFAAHRSLKRLIVGDVVARHDEELPRHDL